MNNNVVSGIISAIMLGLFISGYILCKCLTNSTNTEKRISSNNSNHNDNNKVRYHSNYGYIRNILINMVNKPPQQIILHQQQIHQSKPYYNYSKRGVASIPRFLQVYVECGHNFVPPSQSIPSYRIQCLTPKEGYECVEMRSYLDFIIANYDNPLAEIYIFMHGHNKAWHYINPQKRTMEKLLNSNYIKEENFGGYQCYWNNKPTMIFDRHLTQLFNFLFKNTNVRLERNASWSFPCCGTFFVHTSQIKLRPKSEYIQMVENLKEWSTNYKLKNLFGSHCDGVCARVYEMMWNRILSNTKKVKIPPYCKTEEVMKVNLAITVKEYISWKGKRQLY